MEDTNVDARLLGVESALYGAMAAIHMKHVAPMAGSSSFGADAASIALGDSFASAEEHPVPAPTPAPTAQSTTATATAAAIVTTTTTASGAARGRPRMHGSGRKANRSLRSPVTYAHKLAVINFYDAHERDINATMREFYAHLTPATGASRKRQIYKWVKERAAIEEMCFKQATAGHSRRREKGTATTLGVRGEQELVLWIQTMQRAGPDAGARGGGGRGGGGDVSASAVKAKALEIATRHGVPPGSFQATWSWQQGFFKRHQDAIQRF